jgi:hypothetical protein
VGSVAAFAARRRDALRVAMGADRAPTCRAESRSLPGIGLLFSARKSTRASVGYRKTRCINTEADPIGLRSGRRPGSDIDTRPESVLSNPRKTLGVSGRLSRDREPGSSAVILFAGGMTQLQLLGPISTSREICDRTPIFTTPVAVNLAMPASAAVRLLIRRHRIEGPELFHV